MPQNNSNKESLVGLSLIIITLIYGSYNRDDRFINQDINDTNITIDYNTTKHTEIDDYHYAINRDNNQNLHTQNRDDENESLTSDFDRPKLAIIVDDISIQSEIDSFDSLPFKVNLSIFPPTNRYPNTPELASNLDFYIVHLPLEALNYKQSNALTIDTHIDEIDNIIQNIKNDFPNIKYINNHTGSKFTSNEEAMKRLLTVLDKYDIKFIDSKTTPDSKAKLIDDTILTRDVFLDNSSDIESIKNQLRLAIKIAKKYGQAVAICHPHKTTLEALKSSLDILDDIEIVYIDEIYNKG
jgi:hypothetical protein